MNWFDWVIVVVVLLSVVTAAVHGFFYEVFAVAGVVVGYLLAAWEYPRIATKLQPYVKEGGVADLVGFLAIFFAVLLLAGITAKIARWVVRKAGLDTIDRVLGAAFGLARGLATVSVLALAFAAFAPSGAGLRNSALAGYFVVTARGLTWLAPSAVRQKVREGALLLQHAADQAGEAKSAP